MNHPLVESPRLVSSRRRFLRTAGDEPTVAFVTSTDGKNLPMGVQVVCNPWREDICLAVASHLETKSGGWQRPPI